MKTPLPPEILQRCRNLRRDETPTETLLWTFLRDRRMKQMKFRRQHPVQVYILDFYCQEARLAIELDGGGHYEPDQARYDEMRTKDLETEGIRVLRFRNDEVKDRLEDVLFEIWQILGNEDRVSEEH